MTKFFNKFKKFFGPFSQFWGEKSFLENLALSNTTSYGFLAICQNLEKTNDTIPRKLQTRKDGRMIEGQTLFHRTLPATTESN